MEMRKGDARFVVEDHCTGCGTCAAVCPSDNITVKGKPAFQHHCELCLACTHHCPCNAMRVRGEKNRARFVNGTVTTREIMAANS
ncbi:MAG: hypothetical protein GF331_06270 [Chitinivibrionales bacterium]|nr:hypothetical protein [Chitinivibrionales bacterium]